VWPFVLRHQAALKLVETSALTDTLAQIQQLEEVAERIGRATGQWQTAQEHAAAVTTAAREIAERMTAEQSSFRAFLEKAGDIERTHLRLEVEKLRRAEAEWLQVLVRILDHVYALYVAAVRSGQPGLIEQLGHFQAACRDTARRVGLVPVAAEPGTPFDPKLQQLPDANPVIPEPALVAEMLATGYAFQGQMVRPVLVSLQGLVPPPVEANVVPSLPDPVRPEPTEPAAPSPAEVAHETPAAEPLTPALAAAAPADPAAPSPEPPEDEPRAGSGQPQLPFC
jgi:molecular chaperone GrpE (heat shock protein)